MSLLGQIIVRNPGKGSSTSQLCTLLEKTVCTSSNKRVCLVHHFHCHWLTAQEVEDLSENSGRNSMSDRVESLSSVY